MCTSLTSELNDTKLILKLTIGEKEQATSNLEEKDNEIENLRYFMNAGKPNDELVEQNSMLQTKSKEESEH